MPNTEAINPNMDMEYILASYKDDEPETNAGEGASEPEQQTTTVPEGKSGHDEPTAGTEPAQQEPAKTEVQDAPAGEQQAGAAPAEEDPKKGKDGDGGVAGPDGKTNAASEPAKAGTKGPRRNPLSRLEKAEYSTKKWKRKYREMRESRDALQAELEKYSQINPAQFRDPEERERFIAWKARTEQKLNGMDEDLEDFARRQYEHEYEAKVSAFYPTEDSRNSFEALDEHYGRVLDATCEKLDPDNIILDYLHNSPYEPVLRNIIYKNGPLQEELFDSFGSRAIANATRVQILRQLENQVKAFYDREREQDPQQAARPNNGAPATQQRRFSLPPKKEPAPVQTAQPPKAAEVPPAPAPAPAPVPAPAPQVPPKSSGVTGSLTRGNEGGGLPDESSEANAMYKKLFG